MNDYWENAVTIADNVQAFWTKSVSDVSKGMRMGYVMQETVRCKKNSYHVGTVKIFRATEFKQIPRQHFSAPYG